MSSRQRASEQAIRAAGATLVLLEGAGTDLVQLLGTVGESHAVCRLQRQLCAPSRADRTRALAAILTSIALELDDWSLR